DSFTRDGLDDEPAVGDGRPQQPEMQPAITRALDLARGRELVEHQLDFGKAGPELAEHRREHDRRADKAEHETADLPSRGAPGHPRRLLGLTERAARPVEEALPSFGQLDPALRAPQEE